MSIPPESEPGTAFPPEEARRLLQARGVSAAAIDEALAEDRLHLLVYEHLIMRSEAKYSEREVAELTAMPLELNRRFWRALGFPDADPDEKIFTDADLDALSAVHGLLAMGLADEDVAVQLARVMGSSIARIAAAQVEAVTTFTGANASSARLAELYALTAGGSLDGMARLLEYVWRRHLLAAVRQASMRQASPNTRGGRFAAVGFADMVGFTALSQQLSEPALAAVVSRFEELAYDVVAAGGGRVAKMIGDEAMFVVDDVHRAARIAVELADAYAGDDELSDVRVGLACGAVLAREGDYYGPIVNLASRIVGIARPGTVVVSDAVHRAVSDDRDFSWRPLRSRYLKDIGRVTLWVMSRAAAAPEADRAGEYEDGGEHDGDGPLDEARRQGRRAMRTLLGEAARQRLEHRLRPGS